MEITGKEALQKLADGNKRYIAQKPIHPNQTTDRRRELVKGQKPFAAILSCSDSRVPPEVIFDQGLGDLFVIRVAGNVLDTTTIASAEYAAEHLDVPILVVLGHSKCGAVTAAVNSGGTEGHIGDLMKIIEPAVKKARDMDGDLIDNAIKVNVEMVVEQLKELSPVISHLVSESKLEIIGALYDLESGEFMVL